MIAKCDGSLSQSEYDFAIKKKDMPKSKNGKEFDRSVCGCESEDVGKEYKGMKGIRKKPGSWVGILLK